MQRESFWRESIRAAREGWEWRTPTVRREKEEAASSSSPARSVACWVIVDPDTASPNHARVLVEPCGRATTPKGPAVGRSRLLLETYYRTATARLADRYRRGQAPTLRASRRDLSSLGLRERVVRILVQQIPPLLLRLASPVALTAVPLRRVQAGTRLGILSLLVSRSRWRAACSRSETRKLELWSAVVPADGEPEMRRRRSRGAGEVTPYGFVERSRAACREAGRPSAG